MGHMTHFYFFFYKLSKISSTEFLTFSVIVFIVLLLISPNNYSITKSRISSCKSGNSINLASSDVT